MKRLALALICLLLFPAIFLSVNSTRAIQQDNNRLSIHFIDVDQGSQMVTAYEIHPNLAAQW